MVNIPDRSSIRAKPIKHWLRLWFSLIPMIILSYTHYHQPRSVAWDAGSLTSSFEVSIKSHHLFQGVEPLHTVDTLRLDFDPTTFNEQENTPKDEPIATKSIFTSISDVDITTTRASSEPPASPELNKALHENQRLNIETVWRSILHGLPNATSRNVLEIGMHTAKQCLQAARAGFDAHCIEPSPKSFARVQLAFERGTNRRQFKTKVVKRPWRKYKKTKRHYPVHLYNVAAGNVSGQSVYFHSSGGTGDHVVSESMAKDASVTQVMSLRLDDLILHLDSNILVMKLDVQGFEPIVLEGLVTSLRLKRIDFLLMEVWPKGMKGGCHIALQRLRDAGYTLYPLYNLIGHLTMAPRERHTIKERPYTTLKDFCDWYVHLEDRLVAPNYTFGYWTDVVAVAPHVINGQEGMTHEFWSTFLSHLSQI